MLNWKFSAVCAVAGLSIIVGLVWLLCDTSSSWMVGWAWLIVAGLCGYIVAITPVVGPWASLSRTHKVDIGVPSFFLGVVLSAEMAACYILYRDGINWVIIFYLAAWGVAAVLLITMIRVGKDKAPPKD